MSTGSLGVEDEADCEDDWEELSSDSDSVCSFTDLEDPEALKVRLIQQKNEIIDLRAKLFIATDQLIHFRTFFSLPDVPFAPAPVSKVKPVIPEYSDRKRIPDHRSPTPIFSRTKNSSFTRLYHFVFDDAIHFCSGRVTFNSRFCLIIYLVLLHLYLLRSMF